MRAADCATNRRETADFVSPAPEGAGTSPSRDLAHGEERTLNRPQLRQRIADNRAGKVEMVLTQVDLSWAFLPICHHPF